jgi:hypothetical protein
VGSPAVLPNLWKDIFFFPEKISFQPPCNVSEFRLWANISWLVGFTVKTKIKVAFARIELVWLSLRCDDLGQYLGNPFLSLAP